jgi:hypothetical protein
MRNSLSLSCVFCSVASIEESSLYADKGIIVLALEEPSTVAVDDGDGSWVCDRHVVGLDADDFAVSLVCLIYGKVSSASATLVHEPEVGEGCWERRRDIADGPVA